MRAEINKEDSLREKADMINGAAFAE